MNPRIARVALAAVALVAAGVAAIQPERPDLEITYVYSPDAEELLGKAIRDFNDSDATVDGRRVQVIGRAIASGEAMRQIAEGELDATAWTPASSMWARLLRAQPEAPHATLASRSLVTSPQVFAVFQTTYDRLRLRKSEKFADILTLASDGEVTSDLGHSFKLAHTDPNVSTSGLSAVVSEFSVATTPSSGSLSEQDVLDSTEAVRGYESSIAHYVDIAKDFIDLWCDYGPEFADAAYIQETTFYEIRNHGCNDFKAVYPSDVPLHADYPYLIVNSPAVTDEQREAGHELLEAVVNSLDGDCAHIKSAGFRHPHCKNAAETNDSDFEAPRIDAGVLRQMQAAWDRVRRPASVMLIVDQSRGMAGKIVNVKDALTSSDSGHTSFLDCPRGQDHVGLITFGTREDAVPDEPVPIQPFDNAKPDLEQEIKLVNSEAGHPVLYDAVNLAVDWLESEGPAPIRTIVVLALGYDDNSQSDGGVLLDRLQSLVAEDQAVQIVGVAYGANRDDRMPLEALVESSYGRMFGRTTDSQLSSDASESDVSAVSEFICDYL
jgi:Ca-activated chloride channel family protein